MHKFNYNLYTQQFNERTTILHLQTFLFGFKLGSEFASPLYPVFVRFFLLHCNSYKYYILIITQHCMWTVFSNSIEGLHITPDLRRRRICFLYDITPTRS